MRCQPEQSEGSLSVLSRAAAWCSPHPPLRGPPSPKGEGLTRPSTLSGVEGGVKGVWGKRDLRRRGRMKQITFRAAVKKSNRALLGADFLGTANRKFEGWTPPRALKLLSTKNRGGRHTSAAPLITGHCALYSKQQSFIVRPRDNNVTSLISSYSKSRFYASPLPRVSL